MGRPRKSKDALPKYVEIHHGSYRYKGKKLCRIEDGIAKMYTELAKRIGAGELHMIPAAVAAFKLDHLPTLASGAVRKEHERLLDIFAKEFDQFCVDQVTPPDITSACGDLFGDKLNSAGKFKARVSTFFRWCISKKGLLPAGANPCSDVWLRKPPKHRTKWNDRLFWAMRDKLSPMHQCYHDLSFLLYQRTTDVRTLGRLQIDDEAGVIHFMPSKTARSSGAAVDIPITPEIRKVLDRAAMIRAEWNAERARKGRAPAPYVYVICTKDGSAYTRSGIYSAYRDADEALHGKPIGLNPKDLLPYACTVAKKQGATIEQLRVGRAHSSVKTTEGYIQQHETPVSEVRQVLPERPKTA
jgi:integrase